MPKTISGKIRRRSAPRQMRERQPRRRPANGAPGTKTKMGRRIFRKLKYDYGSRAHLKRSTLGRKHGQYRYGNTGLQNPGQQPGDAEGRRGWPLFYGVDGKPQDVLAIMMPVLRLQGMDNGDLVLRSDIRLASPDESAGS